MAYTVQSVADVFFATYTYEMCYIAIRVRTTAVYKRVFCSGCIMCIGWYRMVSLSLYWL